MAGNGGEAERGFQRRGREGPGRERRSSVDGEVEGITEQRVEATVGLLFGRPCHHTLDVLVKTSDILDVGVGHVVVGSGPLRKNLTSHTAIYGQLFVIF